MIRFSGTAVFTLFLTTIFLFLISSPSFSWGFFAHKKINNLAVFTLPAEMSGFYKKHIDYVTQHAVDPDRRRNNPGEAERHYIDLDRYGEHPFDSLPRSWEKAVDKYSEDTLRKYGIVPWHIQLMVSRLTKAFEQKETDRILKLSADIGHYIADAHVPLHTTMNHDGQLTGQKGIHGLWESAIPELMFETYSFAVGKAVYIENPAQATWTILRHSYGAKDSVLQFEAKLTSSFPSDKKYTHKGKKKVYSEEYIRQYEKMLSGMVERRMREAVKSIGSFWYTAWVNAGQPDLISFPEKNTGQKSVPEETPGNEKKKLQPRGHE